MCTRDTGGIIANLTPFVSSFRACIYNITYIQLQIAKKERHFFQKANSKNAPKAISIIKEEKRIAMLRSLFPSISDSTIISNSYYDQYDVYNCIVAEVSRNKILYPKKDDSSQCITIDSTCEYFKTFFLREIHSTSTSSVSRKVLFPDKLLGVVTADCTGVPTGENTQRPPVQTVALLLIHTQVIQQLRHYLKHTDNSEIESQSQSSEE